MQRLRQSAFGPIRAMQRRGMDEFFTPPFDPKKPPVAAGRAWKASELRLKSFDDLHKLWFVCLKERNRLLTERLYYKQMGLMQPDHTRLRKVRLTMNRIKVVVSERSRVHKAKVAEEQGEAPKPEVPDRSTWVRVKKYGRWYYTTPEKAASMTTKRDKQNKARTYRWLKMRKAQMGDAIKQDRAEESGIDFDKNEQNNEVVTVKG